jgi:hypothetical protein
MMKTTFVEGFGREPVVLAGYLFGTDRTSFEWAAASGDRTDLEPVDPSLF